MFLCVFEMGWPESSGVVSCINLVCSDQWECGQQLSTLPASVNVIMDETGGRLRTGQVITDWTSDYGLAESASG